MSSTARTHLNFNLIAKVTMSRAQSDDLEKRLKELKRYVPGNPVKPHDGFEMIELDTSDELPDNEMARFLDRMVGVRHIHETYQAPREAFLYSLTWSFPSSAWRSIDSWELIMIYNPLLTISIVRSAQSLGKPVGAVCFPLPSACALSLVEPYQS